MHDGADGALVACVETPQAAARAARAERTARLAALRCRVLALAARVADVTARSEAVLEAVVCDRSRWQAWRDGVADVERSAGGDPSRRVVRVCMGCESVCFASQADDPNAAAGTWFEPPGRARDQLLRPSSAFTVVPGCCPTCARSRLPAPASLPPADVIRNVFAEIDVAVAQLLARAPWLDADEAFDDALEAVVRLMAEQESVDETDTLGDALHALAGALHERASSGRAGRRFRPRLRGA